MKWRRFDLTSKYKWRDRTPAARESKVKKKWSQEALFCIACESGSPLNSLLSVLEKSRTLHWPKRLVHVSSLLVLARYLRPSFRPARDICPPLAKQLELSQIIFWMFSIHLLHLLGFKFLSCQAGVIYWTTFRLYFSFIPPPPRKSDEYARICVQFWSYDKRRSITMNNSVLPCVQTRDGGPLTVLPVPAPAPARQCSS